jgi:hypothetical protein
MAIPLFLYQFWLWFPPILVRYVDCMPCVELETRPPILKHMFHGVMILVHGVQGQKRGLEAV